MEKPLIAVQQLTKQFENNAPIFSDLNFQIFPQEVVAILGPSGTGKSTLLRCLNYLTVPTSGIITIDDISVDAKSHTKDAVAKLRSKSSMVFQNYHLFKNKTAMENVTEALLLVKKMKKADAKAIAEDLLNKVGMWERKDFYPSKLSGGQQQRVGIARALALNPQVIFLDEPTSSLDPELVGEVLQTIQKIAQDGTTMLLVTHEISFAKNVANRILFMDEGKIVADGSPQDLLEDSNNPRIQRFLMTASGHLENI